MTLSPTRKDWITYDLRLAAIHEVGHAIVADHVGVEAVGVYLNFHAKADPDVSKFVTGQCQFKLLYSRPSARALRLFSVAGVVAEQLASSNDWCAGSFLDLIESGDEVLSDTDAAGAGRITERLLEDAARILRQHWPELIAEAKHFVGLFKENHAQDADAVEAAVAVLADLDAIEHRFRTEVAQ